MTAKYKVARVGLVVDDVDQVAKDMNELFGMEFATYDVGVVQLRIGASDEGMILVKDISPDGQSSPLHKAWNGPLVNIGIDVPDDKLEEVKDRMEAKGIRAFNYVETPGGLRDYTFEPYHGITFTLYAYPGDSWVKGIAPEEVEKSGPLKDEFI
jgi:hypothetical protein